MLQQIEAFKIVTAKVHCKFKTGLITNECYCSKKHLHTYKNFCVYKFRKEEKCFTYIIFESGFVNICGIKNLDETIDSLKVLCNITKQTNKNWKNNFKYLKKNKKIIADNVTLSGSLKKPIPFDFYLIDLWLKTKFRHKYKSNFNCLHFPGLFVSIRKRSGKIVLFRNGKFNLLGLKCSQDIQNILKGLDALISLMWMTLTKE